ncbi:hypothetical protein PC41400_06730 [Paenibacillus chitinolyticus]|uniref:Uncharacterized protein n=1 Tax=Paenibacillus chitinolyticus TaxID=79263 RepID=A0A410WSQ6_9BACL|nr:hypothetical protein PC41400_06730 [Paenibacillus chitinolyticus]
MGNPPTVSFSALPLEPGPEQEVYLGLIIHRVFLLRLAAGFVCRVWTTFTVSCIITSVSFKENSEISHKGFVRRRF